MYILHYYSPDKTSARNVKTFLSPKAQVGCWKTVKPAQRTSKNNAARKQVKPVGDRMQVTEWDYYLLSLVG